MEGVVVLKSKQNKEHFRGCLLGGAIGDALGYPVEFCTKQEILRIYGEEGITELEYDSKDIAEITDDTQMTLFTAEGIIRYENKREENRADDVLEEVYRAYLRWLSTQEDGKKRGASHIYTGELLNIGELYAKRAPGTTCLSALISGRKGSIDKKINDSKGCGGVMRIAPVGLFYEKDQAFSLGMELAAITHGHPSAYISAGALSYMIACIIEGYDLYESVKMALDKIKEEKGYEETFNNLNTAVELYEENVSDEIAIGILGRGWFGEEALAIAVFCSLKYESDFKRALIVAVNHSGDSDSTGALTGNILGAYLGTPKIPREWRGRIELGDVISHMADILLNFDEEIEEYNRRK